MLKAYVDSQKSSSTTEIMDVMKEMFRDILQQVMESEPETELDCEKSQRTSDSAVENKKLKGFVEAIAAVYPQSQVQCCIIHQIRSSTHFVSYKDIKPLMADLKKVYTSLAED